MEAFVNASAGSYDIRATFSFVRAEDALEVCLSAVGNFHPRKPGDVVQKMPARIREALTGLKSDDPCVTKPPYRLLILAGVEMPRRRGRMNLS
jgi:hypothetical protein